MKLCSEDVGKFATFKQLIDGVWVVNKGRVVENDDKLSIVMFDISNHQVVRLYDTDSNLDIISISSTNGELMV